MNYTDAILLGMVEGLAEFLPISSTGHLILLSYWLEIPDTDFLSSFKIIIQLGAIAAVLLLYWRSFLSKTILIRLALSFAPTALIGFTLYPLVKDVLLSSPLVVVITLALGGVLLILFERKHVEANVSVESIDNISYKQAIIIGFCQAVAIVPGVSRSAATIIGGLLIGLKRVTIVEYSFLLAVPTIAAATGYDILRSYDTFTLENIPLLGVGFVVSFLVALLVITQLLRFLKQHSFVVFGWYRIVLAIIFFIFIL